nr:hypothetical protein [Tanacetum cinerariifolium]
MRQSSVNRIRSNKRALVTTLDDLYAKIPSASFGGDTVYQSIVYKHYRNCHATTIDGIAITRWMDVIL